MLIERTYVGRLDSFRRMLPFGIPPPPPLFFSLIIWRAGGSGNSKKVARSLLQPIRVRSLLPTRLRSSLLWVCPSYSYMPFEPTKSY